MYLSLFVPLPQMAEVQPATPEAGYENLGSSIRFSHSGLVAFLAK